MGGDDTLAITRDWIRLRYSLLPYLWHQFPVTRGATAVLEALAVRLCAVLTRRGQQRRLHRVARRHRRLVVSSRGSPAVDDRRRLRSPVPGRVGLKDLYLTLEMAAKWGLAAPVGAAGMSQLASAVAHGHGASDVNAILGIADPLHAARNT